VLAVRIARAGRRSIASIASKQGSGGAAGQLAEGKLVNAMAEPSPGHRLAIYP
jgi:hypothetical protein